MPQPTEQAVFKKSFFLISFILLVLCFLPALSLPFAHHDPTRFFDKFYAPETINPEKRDPDHSILYLLGRPLTAEIQQLLYTHVSNIEDLNIVRWLTILIFAIGAGILSNIFYSFEFSALESVCISVAILILPGVQDAIIMVAPQHAFAIWATLWAYLVISRPDRSALTNLFNVTLIFCLLLTSMFLYPQWSFFIFVPAIVKYMIAPSENLRSIHQDILKIASLFIITSIFYFFYIKTFVAFNDARAGSYAFSIDLNFFYWKFIKVFSNILPMAFNLWNFHTRLWLGWVLMVLTMVLLKRRAILCFLLMLSTAGFWLLIRTDIILPRIFFVTSAMALTFILVGVRQILKPHKTVAKYMITAAMVFGIVQVHFLTLDNALNYHLEFSFIKQRLIAYQKPISRIHIVLPINNGKGYNGQDTVGDSFNGRTASYNFNTDMLNLLKAALREAHAPNSWYVYSCDGDQQKCVGHLPSGYRLLVTHSEKKQPLFYSPGMVLIDLNDL